MRPNPYPTPFIDFEGIDGSGKTTQTHLLVKELEKSVKVLSTKPNKGTETGKKIYQILENKDEADHKELQGLFIENHRERLQDHILPALEEGTWVVSDRYVFTSFAYGLAEGVDLNWMLELTESFLTPNIIFYITTTPEEGMRRIQDMGKPVQKLFEQEHSLKRNRDAYGEIISQFSEFHMIDGMQNIEKVHEDIMEIIEEHYP